jgi:hypothetical protein
MNSSSTSAGGMSAADSARQLRVIEVTSRLALGQVGSPNKTRLVQARVAHLLNDLEVRVRQDGATTSTLASIDAARRDLLDHEDG